MPELRRSLIERLQVIARGPRSYAQDNSEIGSLLKRGLVQETGQGVSKAPLYGAATPRIRDHRGGASRFERTGCWRGSVAEGWRYAQMRCQPLRLFGRSETLFAPGYVDAAMVLAPLKNCEPHSAVVGIEPRSTVTPLHDVDAMSTRDLDGTACGNRIALHRGSRIQDGNWIGVSHFAEAPCSPQPEHKPPVKRFQMASCRAKRRRSSVSETSNGFDKRIDRIYRSAVKG